MQTKNLTPFLFGTKLTSLQPPEPQMTVIVRGAYRLKPGEPLAPIEDLISQPPLSADVFGEGDEERKGECLYPSDFAEFKLHAEVMLRGTCHPPGARPLPECPVRFSVGTWSKSLLVVGRRVWTEKVLGAAISDPLPFNSMPIGYDHAFGGPSYPLNPSGKGRDAGELPNVEHPGERVRGKGDKLEPAGFGPLNPNWPQRAGKVGKDYGRKWRAERAPFYATDFDWTHFNSAPLDQQLPGYLRGDEEIAFVNLHPAAPKFSARLPGLRMRVFVKDDTAMIREPPMKLDTLFVDLDKELVLLTWRGVVSVRENDFADVTTVLVATEPQESALLTEAHYRKIIEEFEADPLEIDKRLPGAKARLASIAATAKDNDDHPERSPADQARAYLEGQDGSMAPEGQRGMVENALADAKTQLASLPPIGETPKSPKPIETPLELLARAAESVGKLKDLGVASEDVDQLQALIDDPETRKAAAKLSPPKPEEIGPGKDLSNRNLARMDLTGRDLSGAKLEGANLFGAKLRGARLQGADLRKALLMEADLTAADLRGADLSRAMFARAHAAGADLSRTKLDQALIQDADFTGARFDGTTGQMTILSGSKLADASFKGCVLFKAFAGGAVLERADFTDANLTQSSFVDTKADAAIFVRALITGVTFLKSELRRAVFREARGEGTSFMRAELEGAEFRLAVLPTAHFMEAKAIRGTFFGADLRRSEFYRTTLDRADFEKANLFAASFNKARLHGTRFVDANLYDARFLGAGGKGVDFQGANLTRAMLPS